MVNSLTRIRPPLGRGYIPELRLDLVEHDRQLAIAVNYTALQAP